MPPPSPSSSSPSPHHPHYTTHLTRRAQYRAGLGLKIAVPVIFGILLFTVFALWARAAVARRRGEGIAASSDEERDSRDGEGVDRRDGDGGAGGRKVGGGEDKKDKEKMGPVGIQPDLSRGTEKTDDTGEELQMAVLPRYRVDSESKSLSYPPLPNSRPVSSTPSHGLPQPDPKIHSRPVSGTPSHLHSASGTPSKRGSTQSKRVSASSKRASSSSAPEVQRGSSASPVPTPPPVPEPVPGVPAMPAVPAAVAFAPSTSGSTSGGTAHVEDRRTRSGSVGSSSNKRGSSHHHSPSTSHRRESHAAAGHGGEKERSSRPRATSSSARDSARPTSTIPSRFEDKLKRPWMDGKGGKGGVKEKMAPP